MSISGSNFLKSGQAVRFQGASPELTTRFYTQLIPNRNDEVVFQVSDRLNPSNVTVSRGKGTHIFSQDPQWVFEEPDRSLQVKARPEADLPDFLRNNPQTSPLESNLYGGNCYLGLKASGKPYCLVGQRVVNTSGKYWEEALPKIAKDLEIRDTGNITVIPQSSEWFLNDIDTFIRPLNGNTILVYDPETTRKFLADNNIQRVSAIAGLDPESGKSYSNIQYILEKRGFRVIKAPGLFHYEGRAATGQPMSFDVSLLNGLVRKDPQSGKLVYLTMDPAKNDLKAAFSAWLQKECPEISQVIYVDGDGPKPGLQPFPNRMVQIFNEEKGGLHCMFGEVIDGQKWRTANW